MGHKSMKIYIFLILILTAKIGMAETILGRASDGRGLYPGFPYCIMGIGSNYSEAKKMFIMYSGVNAETIVDAECENGWTAVVTTDGSNEEKGCGQTCGEKSKQVAIDKAKAACEAQGRKYPCDNIRAYRDENGLAEMWENGSIKWSR